MKIDYYKVLRNYFSGRKSSEGDKIFERWFSQSADMPMDEETIEEKEAIKKRIQEKLFKTILTDSSKSNTIPMFATTWHWYAAASVLVFCMITYMYSNFFIHNDKAVAHIEKFNGTNAVSRIVLPDGSIVQLKGKSRIRFPKHFTNNRREVFLEGEAFFNVVRDTAKQFIVSSGKVRTVVLGTSFNVKAYPDHSTVEVLVSTGKVAVEDTVENTRVTLLPQQRAVYEQRAGILRKDTIPPPLDNSLSEKEGEIIFNDFPLVMAIEMLHKKYGVSIMLTNTKLENCKVNLTFKDKTVNEIIEDICKQTATTYSIEASHYSIHGNGCANK